MHLCDPQGGGAGACDRPPANSAGRRPPPLLGDRDTLPLNGGRVRRPHHVRPRPRTSHQALRRPDRGRRRRPRASPHGTFVCLLGPSGCGKTTLLRMIAGLEEPTAGRSCSTAPTSPACRAHQRDFGMVFQSLALFPHLTVGENIAYPLRIRGAAEGGAERRGRRASGSRASARLRRPAGRQAFRRAAAAGRDRPRAGALAKALPARRAALGARRKAARGDAGGAPAAAASGSASPPSSSPTTSARR